MNKGLGVSGWVTLLIAAGIFILVATNNQTTGYRQLRNDAQRSMQERHEGAIRKSDQARNDPVSLFMASLASASPSSGSALKGMVYVPAYSTIRLASGRSRLDLATTLSIHNTSRDRALVLERVDYHNTEGDLVHAYLETPIALKPFGTIEMFVSDDDRSGGGGANFVVHWSATEPITKPIMEAVMMGAIGTTSYSFVSQGRVVTMNAEE
jgi:hypothetical protein